MKKGFTLIELLTVLVILAIISVIVIPTITNSIEEAKENAYKEQVNTIKQAAESYFIDSNYEVKEDEKKVIYVKDIKDEDYVSNSELINPKDEKEMTGCVLINYYSGQYHYNYLEDNNDCIKYTNIKE